MYINILIFLLIAVVYSSAGFGGGSLYLAILSQGTLAVSHVRFTALTCNAVVTAGSTWHFAKEGSVRFKRLWPLLATSIPCCVATSMMNFQGRSYFVTLALCLLFAAIAMVWQERWKLPPEVNAPINPWWLPLASGGIGAAAGLTGIGGGVYLAPLLYLTRWGQPKEIAGASAIFILLNSIAGLVTQYYQTAYTPTLETLWLMLTVAVGGWFGARIGNHFFSQKTVRRVTIVILCFAAIRLLMKHL
jgi:uncharacterized protein